MYLTPLSSCRDPSPLTPELIQLHSPSARHADSSLHLTARSFLANRSFRHPGPWNPTLYQPSLIGSSSLVNLAPRPAARTQSLSNRRLSYMWRGKLYHFSARSMCAGMPDIPYVGLASAAIDGCVVAQRHPCIVPTAPCPRLWLRGAPLPSSRGANTLHAFRVGVSKALGCYCPGCVYDRTEFATAYFCHSGGPGNGDGDAVFHMRGWVRAVLVTSLSFRFIPRWPEKTRAQAASRKA